jgi:hypothetical protein
VTKFRMRAWFAAILLGNVILSPNASASPTVVSDITDFITSWGGWFYDVKKSGAPSDNFWVQKSYSATAKDTYLITLTVIYSPLEKLNQLAGGSACSQLPVETDTLIFDLRYIDPDTLQVSASPATVQAPTGTQLVPGGPVTAIYTFSAATRNIHPGPGSSALPLVRRISSVVVPSCPTPNQTWKAGTEQTDLTQFAIEFADGQQANYLKTLLTSYLRCVTPPGDGGTTSVPATCPAPSSTTGGNQPSGNQTSGNQTSGNQTSGNQTSGPAPQPAAPQ